MTIRVALAALSLAAFAAPASASCRIHNDTGTSFTGSCKDGDRLEIVDDHGVPVLTVK